MLLYISGFNSTPKAFISNNQSVDVYYVIENDYAKDISRLGEIIRQHPNHIDIAGHSTGGFYALTLKTIFPDQIRRLHLINPAMDLVKILGNNSEPKAQEFLENGRTDMVAQYNRNRILSKNPDVFLYQGLLDDRVDVQYNTLFVREENTCIYPDMGHRFSEQEFLQIMGDILSHQG